MSFNAIPEKKSRENFRIFGARRLNFNIGLSLLIHLRPNIVTVYVSSKGSGETARVHAQARLSLDCSLMG